MNFLIEAILNMSIQTTLFHKTCEELERELIHTQCTTTRIDLRIAQEENDEAHEDLIAHFSN